MKRGIFAETKPRSIEKYWLVRLINTETKELKSFAFDCEQYPDPLAAKSAVFANSDFNLDWTWFDTEQHQYAWAKNDKK
jgi:hypothetical protein